MIKRLAARLPHSIQQRMRRTWYRYHIGRDRFKTDEPEFSMLDQWIRPGDCVIDVGANVGIYTRRMSELVGPSGRVIALEPVPSTFELLASNTADLGNVTLIQAAAVHEPSVVAMSVPTFDSGLRNHYQASIQENGELAVLGIVLRDLKIPPPTMVKIDAEGHDLDVLRGLPDDHMVPVLLVEDDSDATRRFLAGLGYRAERIEGSPNTIWRFPAAA